MKNLFICNICKKYLEIDRNEIICNSCKIRNKYKENYIDFSGKNNFNFNDFPEKKLDEIAINLEKNGYSETINKFFNNNTEFSKEISDNKSSDMIFHCLKKENEVCLEIGSGFGKNIEVLSKNFQEVYSLEWDERKIKFQKYRFKENGISNVKIIRCDPFKLPFPDNHFDLVLCNGVIELIGNVDKGIKFFTAQKKFLKELKRVIKKNGCFSVGVENGSSFAQIVKKDTIFRKFEKFKKKNTFQEYQKIFQDLELHYDAYWALPSLIKPYFSGKINDKISTKWFYENYSKFLLKEKQSKLKKIGLSVFGKINNSTSNTISKKIIPNFVFCCYKNEEFLTYEKFLLTKIEFKNFILMGRKSRLIYILFNEKGDPKKIISVHRLCKNFSNKIEKCIRKIPNMRDPTSRIWMEDWILGDEINPTNVEDLSKALTWLIDFQRKSQTNLLSNEEKHYEVEWFKKRIINFPEINIEKYLKWLDDYEEFLLENKIFKVARHGDFWYTNILLDKKTNKINLVDWENFIQEGNPFYDFLTFILHLMTLTPKNYVEIFKESLEMKGFFGEVMKKMKPVIDDYFGFEFNLIILLRFFIMRNIIRSNIKGKKLKNHIRMLEILSDEKHIMRLVR